MGKGCSGSEGELESLLKEETTKYHKVVPIAVLRLHDGRRLQPGCIHMNYIVGFTKFIIWVFTN